MAVYENIFLKFSQNFLSKARLKHFLIGNHYRTIFGAVKNGVLFIHCVVHIEIFCWKIAYSLDQLALIASTRITHAQSLTSVH